MIIAPFSAFSSAGEPDVVVLFWNGKKHHTVVRGTRQRKECQWQPQKQQCWLFVQRRFHDVLLCSGKSAPPSQSRAVNRAMLNSSKRKGFSSLVTRAGHKMRWQLGQLSDRKHSFAREYVGERGPFGASARPARVLLSINVSEFSLSFCCYRCRHAIASSACPASSNPWRVLTPEPIRAATTGQLETCFIAPKKGTILFVYMWREQRSLFL